MKRIFRHTICLVLAVALTGIQPLTHAALPGIFANNWVIGVGGSLAGSLVYAAGKWIFKESTEVRPGILEAEPSLSVGTNTEEIIHWYHNKMVGRSTYNVTDERKLGQYDLKVAWIVWDDAQGKYVDKQTDDYFGGSFKDSFSEYMTSGKDSDGYVREGYYLEKGSSKKVKCEHWVNSKVSGDLDLAKEGDFFYDATVQYKLSDMRYKGGGNWDYLPQEPKSISESLSAIGDDKRIVPLLTSNTRLDESSVDGWSELYWEKATRWAPVSGISRDGRRWIIDHGVQIKEWKPKQRKG